MQETDLVLIKDAILAAGDIAVGFAGQSTKSWEKPGGAGPVTEADLAVNDYLESTLRDARPEYGWLSEESEDTDDRMSRDTVFIIDPIDGTRSFQDGSRTWAHSVAIAYMGQVIAGAVYLPMRDMLYTAARGKGAYLNGSPMHVSATQSLSEAEVLAARPIMEPRYWQDGVPHFNRSHRPSLAYRLGLVGQGRFDAMLTFRPTWEWDVAAGALIVEEAKGTCTDRTGAGLRFNNKVPMLNGMIASGTRLHGQLLQAMQF